MLLESTLFLKYLFKSLFCPFGNCLGQVSSFGLLFVHFGPFPPTKTIYSNKSSPPQIQVVSLSWQDTEFSRLSSTRSDKKLVTINQMSFWFIIILSWNFSNYYFVIDLWLKTCKRWNMSYELHIKSYVTLFEILLCCCKFFLLPFLHYCNCSFEFALITQKTGGTFMMIGHVLGYDWATLCQSSMA